MNTTGGGTRRTGGRFAAATCAAVLACAAALGLADAAGAAQMYRWTDTEGNVHFSDRPPDQGEAASVEGPKAPTIGEVLERERQEERARRQAELRARQEKAEREAEIEASAPKDTVHSKYTCEEARKFAEHYAQPDQEFYTADAEGNFVLSTPEQVAATLAEWRSAAEVLCQEDVEVVNEPLPAATAAAPAQ